MKNAPVIIRKYENRRLYDTSKSRYINLEDIAAMVQNGTDIHVVDAASGEDLTRLILTQIIVENAKSQPSSLPIELLRELIKVTDHVGREFITWYLRSAFDAYHKVQKTLRTGLEEANSAASSPLELLQRFLPSAKSRESDSSSNELKALRARIARLESEKQPAKRSGQARRTSKPKPRQRPRAARKARS